MSARIGICDYGVGNLRSVERALLAAGAEPVLSHEASVLAGCAGVVLPGVGAFAVAAAALASTGLGSAVRAMVAGGTPLLGVCLGHQLLFDWSDENGGVEGLGLLGGRITRLDPSRGKVPHVGWNRLRIRRASPLLAGVADGAYAYFVHSYVAAAAAEDVVAVSDYGAELDAVCARGHVFGTQFHPEKSGADGLRIYRNFVAVASGDGRAGGSDDAADAAPAAVAGTAAPPGANGVLGSA